MHTKGVKLIFSRVPVENMFSLVRRTQPLVRYLEDHLGVDVALQVGLSYDALIQNMLQGTYHFVLVGPEVYCRASLQGAKYMARCAPVREGQTDYRGAIVVRQDSEIERVDQLKGRSVAFVDRVSVGGFRFPKRALQQAGLSLEDLGRHRFVGSHDGVLREVLDGKFDAGGCFEDAPNLYLPGVQARQIRILERTGRIPNEPLALSADFESEYPELSRKLVATLVAMGKNPTGLKTLERLSAGQEGFGPTTDAAYASLRRLVQADG